MDAALPEVRTQILWGVGSSTYPEHIIIKALFLFTIFLILSFRIFLINPHSPSIGPLSFLTCFHIALKGDSIFYYPFCTKSSQFSWSLLAVLPLSILVIQWTHTARHRARSSELRLDKGDFTLSFFLGKTPLPFIFFNQNQKWIPRKEKEKSFLFFWIH